ncbi:MAG: EAL domain-containing protein [Erythrobacter sp.]|nr:EAL domain-containing protein [Erythrobacter sp.]
MWLTRISRENRDAQIGAAAFAVATLITVGIILSGFASFLEESLRDGRDRMRLAPASGEIVIVEIDGRSLEALDQWPWPRGHHAKAIKELDRLGASQIAFDVDFSAFSSPEEDAKLAQAFASIDQPAILPTFRQLNEAGGQRTITEALPIPAFRDNTFVASVNVSPSPDGKITMYPHGTTTNGTARPSLANMLAKSSGEVDRSFRVDQAIDIRTIPRVSFIDLVEGRVPRSAIADNRVVIGATAIELFDRYPTALFGVQPGVVIQVQAAETLLQERVRSSIGQWIPFGLVALVLAAFLGLRARAGRGAESGGLVAVGLATILVVVALTFDQAAWPYVAWTGSLSFLLTYYAAHRAIAGAVNLEAERLTDTASRLPNRRAMLNEQGRRDGAMVAVCRIADFAEVLTAVGNEYVAELDRAIARRLRLMTDVDEVYRLDSGLFGWFLSSDHREDPDDAFAAARAVFTSPFEIAAERLRLGVHFGYAAGSVEDAETASETARQRGLGWSSNARALHEETQFRQRLLGELDDALSNGAITVLFQPKLRLSDKAIVAGECLVRWNSPQLGRISPADFIPILEDKGRILDLTLFVLREAIDRRGEAAESGRTINLAVNVSAQLLSDPEFIKSAIALLDEGNARENGGITFEITESAPLVDSHAARASLDALSSAGARISIDDYGTGQASLNYLQDFPAQEIKLDQSFVRNLVSDHKDRIMVQSTIELAHALGFEIVAEGVEDAETLLSLAALGCDYAQGWEIGKPAGWSTILAMLDRKWTLEAAA